MGVDYNVYVGPYIEYRVQIITTLISPCTQEDCPKSQDPYCPQCGMSAEKQSKMLTVKREEPEIYFWEEPFNERFYNPRSHSPLGAEEDEMKTYQALPNIGNWGDNIDPKYEEDIIEMQNLDIQEIVSRFEYEFEKELNILKEMCGIENVEVKYGVLVYMS